MPLVEVVEVDTYTEKVFVPQPGDLDTTASLVASVQSLSNRTKNLEQHTYVGDPNGNTHYWTVSLGQAYYVPADWGIGPLGPGGSGFDFITGGWPQQVLPSGGGNPILFVVQPPMRGKITSFSLHIHGNYGGGAPHAALPAVKPSALLVAYKNAAAMTALASTTDAPANVGAYETPHFTPEGYVGGGGHAIDYKEQLAILVSGEDGANALANYLSILSARIAYAPVEVL